ncbi:MAG TPA: S-layer homology domain-containing protein [Bacillus bacterium]|nr:S-layer homology domain-containing protein [Bacillus sp. (in: firmicutes)]
MKKWVKKSFPIVVASSLAFSLIPNGAYAKSDNGKGKGNDNREKIEQKLKGNAKKKFELHDVEKHWAHQDIYKTYSLGLMSGLDDFTYQPNKPVTQLEAISALVKVLEMDDKERNPSLNNKNLQDIPSSARKTVAIAIEENLLESTKKFQPNKPATRLFITNLLVKFIGTDINSWKDATLSFKDVDNLSKEEKANLAFATLTKLISGFSDQTFQPNKPVTRAEMAVFINRLLDYKEELGDYYNQSGKGTIEAINIRDSEITIRQRVKVSGEWKYVSKKYVVDEDAKIFVDGKASTFSKLTTNLNVEFTIDKYGDIIYMNAKSVVEKEKDYSYKGVITKVENNIVWIKIDVINIPFYINNNVKITTMSGAKGEIANLKVDQTISFNLDSSAAIAEILIN